MEDLAVIANKLCKLVFRARLICMLVLGIDLTEEAIKCEYCTHLQARFRRCETLSAGLILLPDSRFGCSGCRLKVDFTLMVLMVGDRSTVLGYR
jgi:hypothetical protein